ncbi:ABC transporter permease [Arsenicitalea aurantiaca]|uniref:ABC transporter permease n=1 Tax=Arsenicitalea aurantiaca TaxID=1783274 RepID=A0A433X2P1_9HYPH|nr:ABC transporter permease [Arsenicitalea aurantiaca]RUT28297.1 ABC transporter permease [Arsenicitalea aurantiaca]
MSDQAIAIDKRSGQFNGALLERLRRLGIALILPASIIAAWHLTAVSGRVPAYLLPQPLEVLNWLVRLVSTGELQRHLSTSIARAGIGFALGVSAATVLGVLTGYLLGWRRVVDPTIHALRTIPGLAWSPMFILWFGIGESSKYALIALVTFFPVYLNTMAGVAGVDRKLIEVGRVNRLSGLRMMTRILLPASLPSYFVGLRQSMGIAWIVLVAAELMGASSGIGFLLLDGQMTGRPALVMACMIIFALCGKITDIAISTIARHVLAWQDTLHTGE